jgi:hypothetical protein
MAATPPLQGGGRQWPLSPGCYPGLVCFTPLACENEGASLDRRHAEGVKHISPRQRLGIGVRRGTRALQGRSTE